jgi:hypothetical protein
MPSKKSARKQREKKNDEVDWRAALEQFKKDGTGSAIEDTLLKEFPLFHGKAPPGHPYPQAFTEGAIDKDYCYIERVDDDLVLLRRKLPSGRVISIDTCDFAMLNGGAGIALNMNNADNRVENLKWVKEDEARKLLMEFEESDEKRYQIVTVLPNGLEQVNDVPGDSTDIMQAYCSFSQATERVLQLQAVAPSDIGRHGLKVMQIGTEKVMARLELNPPDQAEKKAAFAALSVAIEATAALLPEETYRQLYDKAKVAFNAIM